MTPQLETLLERCRKAQGPDWALDAAIAAAFAYQPVRAFEDDDATYCIDGNNQYIVVERVTASIDAALGLVTKLLPGKQVLMGYGQTQQTHPWARVGEWRHADATGQTLPLAIIIATLEALTQEQ